MLRIIFNLLICVLWFVLKTMKKNIDQNKESKRKFYIFAKETKRKMLVFEF
jgi:lysophospholipid acyltransferase (LPLAT)-like uncharacterized protein